MIQPKELRIGNYISRLDLGNEEIRVEQVLELNEKVKTKGAFETICEFSDIKPTSLTKEWLINFGFEANDYNDEFVIIKGAAVYTLDCEYTDKGVFNFVIGEDCIHGDIKHVHQLQNLYFALTGEELILHK